MGKRDGEVRTAMSVWLWRLKVLWGRPRCLAKAALLRETQRSLGTGLKAPRIPCILPSVDEQLGHPGRKFCLCLVGSGWLSLRKMHNKVCVVCQARNNFDEEQLRSYLDSTRSLHRGCDRGTHRNALDEGESELWISLDNEQLAGWRKKSDGNKTVERRYWVSIGLDGGKGAAQ